MRWVSDQKWNEADSCRCKINQCGPSSQWDKGGWKLVVSRSSYVMMGRLGFGWVNMLTCTLINSCRTLWFTGWEKLQCSFFRMRWRKSDFAAALNQVRVENADFSTTVMAGEMHSETTSGRVLKKESTLLKLIHFIILLFKVKIRA